MSFSDSLEVDVLTWAFTDDAAPTRPTAWYVALFSTSPGEAGTGTELTGTGYARQQVTGGFTTPASGAAGCSNPAAITYTNSGGTNWPAASHFGIFTASTGGTYLGGAALAASKTVGPGDSATFAIGDLVITLD